jgi:hypothetical protein
MEEELEILKSIYFEEIGSIDLEWFDSFFFLILKNCEKKTFHENIFYFKALLRYSNLST